MCSPFSLQNQSCAILGLLTEIKGDTRIVRTAAILLPQQLPWRLRTFISRWFLIVDEQVGWLPFAVSTGRRMLAADHFRAIYSTSTPYTDHLIAYQLHQQSGLPWIADFRDPWIGNMHLRFATPWHKSIVQNMERRIVQSADRIIVVSPPMGESFCKRIPDIPSTKVFCVPNGYDLADFENAQPQKRTNDVFYLVYTGSFYTQGRTAEAFLRAINAIVVSGQIPRQKLRIQLVGDLGKATRRWIGELGLEDIIETPGCVSHAESIGYLISADALLLVIGDSQGSAAVFTGKIFEYLAAGKPVLCLAGEGVSSQLIREAHVGVTVRPNDTPRIAKAVTTMYRAWENGELRVNPNMEVINSFERRKLTEQLANILSSLDR